MMNEKTTLRAYLRALQPVQSYAGELVFLFVLADGFSKLVEIARNVENIVRHLEKSAE